MNTTTKNATRIIGAFIVIAALALGAFVGQYTSPSTPANAVNPVEGTCTIMCADTTQHGTIGNAPAPLSGGSGSIGTPVKKNLNRG